ncbi:hypothetical protein HYU90_01900 [Candidatus Collierbacteria bacterium]|nr:hypothetical protein [Candidatus Collierbacteria bacterium]
MSQTSTITAINLACGEPGCEYDGGEKVIASVNMAGFTDEDVALLNQYAESGFAALSAEGKARLKVLLGDHLTGCPDHGEEKLGFRVTEVITEVVEFTISPDNTDILIEVEL